MDSSPPLRLLLIVAHPDDAEARSGGLMTLYRRAGHVVKWISVTNGDAGHHEISGPELADIRREESARAAAVIGADFEIWDHHDGQLEPTLERRWEVIRAIRRFQPDLVLTHRTCDYHPDHRAVAQLVQDASFSVTVPAIVPDTPALSKDPVVAYMADLFTRPACARTSVFRSMKSAIPSSSCFPVTPRRLLSGCLSIAETSTRFRPVRTRVEVGCSSISCPASTAVWPMPIGRN